MTEQEIFNPEKQPVEAEEKKLQDQTQPEDVEEITDQETTEEDIDEPVDEETLEDVARSSSTVGEFEAKLENLSAGDSNQSLDSENYFGEAAKNLREISHGYKSYRVTPDLSNGGRPAGGDAEVGTSDVRIDAAHLASVGSEEGKKNVHKTFRHEKEHTEQVKLPSDFEVIDPKTGQKIDKKILYEGGAEKVVADELGGGKQSEHVAKSNESGMRPYQKGFELYNSYDEDVLNKAVKKEGENPGDKVALQADLAREAGIRDEDRLLDLGQRAGFSEKEKEELLEKSQE